MVENDMETINAYIYTYLWINRYYLKILLDIELT